MNEELTVKQFLDIAKLTHSIVLKDGHTGREYTKTSKYLDRIVLRCDVKIDTDRGKNIARPVLVVWIKHDWENHDWKNEKDYAGK